MTLVLGAKGAVELQLISSGEKWGRGPEQGHPLEPQGQCRQPGVAPGQGAQHAGLGGRPTPAIDGWFENVKPLTARQKELIAADVAAGNEADEMKVLGIKHWYKDEDYLTAS